tara:strand:- start:179 stop:724 length:546 start_codon:yes stop_codon:yes gene_type:complete
MTITLTADAYCVTFMHACKHPSRTVNGLLLGSASGGDVSASKAMPLFHGPLGLAPMLEAALMLADEYCKANGLKIVGYYQANEMADDMELGPFGKKIAEKIRKECPDAAVLMIDGKSMRPDPDNLRLTSRTDAPNPTLANPAATLATLERLLESSAHQQLVDFDQHLDDPSKDWLNSGLVK